MFASLKMLFVYVALGTPAALLGLPYTLIVGDISLLYRVAMWIMGFGVRVAGIRVRVHGLENVPAGRSCIFMCNHVSNLDPPAVLPILPGRSSVLLKKELMKIPLLGTAMRLGKYIPVERSRSREAARQSMLAAADALNSGLHIVVFPEGTRSPDGRLSAFKRGPFYLALETGAPVLPIALSGTQGMMRKGSYAITPGVAEVHLLPAIESSQFTTREDLLKAVHEAIGSALPPEMQPLSI